MFGFGLLYVLSRVKFKNRTFFLLGVQFSFRPIKKLHNCRDLEMGAKDRRNVSIVLGRDRRNKSTLTFFPSFVRNSGEYACVSFVFWSARKSGDECSLIRPKVRSFEKKMFYATGNRMWAGKSGCLSRLQYGQLWLATIKEIDSLTECRK